jgi:enoyl-CoA hydratase/carnithine racemase
MDYSLASYRDLLVKRVGHSLWITLNRPDFSNAYSEGLVADLPKLLELADRDAEVRVILLTGAGKSFSAGGDIKAMKDETGMFAGGPNQLRLAYERGIQQISKAMEALQTPIIAVVNGAAVGAGCDLTCMCDLRLASESAKFAVTFAKLGLVPGDGGTFFLPRVVGQAKALEMYFLGKSYSAQEALAMGLVNEVCADDKLISRAQEVADAIGAQAPIAIALTKKAIKSSSRLELWAALDLLAAFQGIAQRTDDHHEGVSALLEKRSPKFHGR